MPYKTKGKCVYKKDTGKKVGCTKGSVKKYLAALHANVNESDDLGWMSDVPIEETRTVSEWYRSIEEFRELVNVGDIVYISGLFYDGEGGVTLQNEEFRVVRMKEHYNIALTPLNDTLRGGDITQLGEFEEDYDLKMTVKVKNKINESDLGWMNDAMDDRKGYIITFPYPWRINNEITAKRLYDTLVKRYMNASTGSVYDEDGHDWEDLDYEFREYLDAYEEEHDELPVHIPKEFWFDKEYWDLSELTIERSEDEIKEIYVYPDNGIALSDTEISDMFLNKWAQTSRNSIPTIDAREVFPELYNVNESEVKWMGDVRYNEEEVITNYIKTEMSDMLREYSQDIIFIELEDLSIIHIWTMGLGGEDYDILEIEMFSEWSELRHNYDMYERNIDEYMENIENDMAFMNEVHRLKKKYINKLEELVPVRRTFTFENIY